MRNLPDFRQVGGVSETVGGCVSFVGSNLMELVSISSFYVSLLRIGGWRVLVGGKLATSDTNTFPPHGGDDIVTPLRGGYELPATAKGTGIITNILKEIPMKLLEHAAYSYALHTLEGIAPSL